MYQRDMEENGRMRWRRTPASSREALGITDGGRSGGYREGLGGKNVKEVKSSGRGSVPGVVVRRAVARKIKVDGCHIAPSHRRFPHPLWLDSL